MVCKNWQIAKEDGRDKVSDQEEVEQAVQGINEVREQHLVVWARDPERAVHLCGQNSRKNLSWRACPSLRGSRLRILGDSGAMDPEVNGFRFVLFSWKMFIFP